MDKTFVSKTLFENTSCSRCGGSGRYSYCQMYGDRCFKCGGSGVQLTKRGAEAQRYYRELLTVPARDVQLFDIVESPSMFDGNSKARVIDLPFCDPAQVSTSTTNGVTTTHQMVTIRTNKGTWQTYLDAPMRRYNAALTRAAKEQALAYQASLTERGTVRKVKKVAA